MFGLTIEKVIVIAILAAVLIGPDKLPQAADALARFVKQLKRFTEDTKTRVRDEVGPEFDEVDWSKLDPRKYDPRRIMREAIRDTVGIDDLLAPPPVPVKGSGWRRETTPSEEKKETTE